MIAQRLRMPRVTGAVLRRHGQGRLGPVAAPEPVRRYERARLGEWLHVDIETLGRIGQAGHRVHGDRRRHSRGIGWEHVHVCIDDATRVAYGVRYERTRPYRPRTNGEAERFIQTLRGRGRRCHRCVGSATGTGGVVGGRSRGYRT